jgi:hypothetical protein
MIKHERLHSRLVISAVLCVSSLACGGSESTGPQNTPDKIVLTGGQVHSLDSAGQAIVAANPGNATLKAIVDSTLQALTVGAVLTRLDVSTNVTTAPLYFIGIHRTASLTNHSYSTWNVVGFDDPAHLTVLVEVSGFAENGTSTPPTSVSGTIGDGSGIVNGHFIQVGSGGSITMWDAGSGTASFHSDASTGSCPNFTPPNPGLSCSLETTHLQFSATAASGSGGAGSRQASLASEAAVSAMKMIYVAP